MCQTESNGARLRSGERARTTSLRSGRSGGSLSAAKTAFGAFPAGAYFATGKIDCIFMASGIWPAIFILPVMNAIWPFSLPLTIFT